MRPKKVLKIVAIAIVAVTVLGFVVMNLWNWLVGTPSISDRPWGF